MTDVSKAVENVAVLCGVGAMLFVPIAIAFAAAGVAYWISPRGEIGFLRDGLKDDVAMVAFWVSFLVGVPAGAVSAHLITIFVRGWLS